MKNIREITIGQGDNYTCLSDYTYFKKYKMIAVDNNKF